MQYCAKTTNSIGINTVSRVPDEVGDVRGGVVLDEGELNGESDCSEDDRDRAGQHDVLGDDNPNSGIPVGFSDIFHFGEDTILFGMKKIDKLPVQN